MSRPRGLVQLKAPSQSKSKRETQDKVMGLNKSFAARKEKISQNCYKIHLKH